MFLLALLAGSVRSLLLPILGSSEMRSTYATATSRRNTPRMGGTKDGPFTPVVQLTKRLIGKERFLKFRGSVISEHTKVIQAFVDTAETPFGCMALKKLFDLADMDGNGTIDND